MSQGVSWHFADVSAVRMEGLDVIDQDWIDGRGIAFADYRKRLPKRTADFPKAGIIRDGDLLRSYRSRFTHCQLCGIPLRKWDVKPELHHIVGGVGRSDEAANLILLCDGFDGCHSKVQGAPDMLPIVLAAKCLTDRDNADWLRLAVLAGKFLPKPRWPLFWKRIREKNLK